MGCDQVQGYYYSRPVDARTITGMLLQGPAWTKGDRRGASEEGAGADRSEPLEQRAGSWRREA
jgi:predicted signal transduction protein with EAL and GGDEF domain